MLEIVDCGLRCQVSRNQSSLYSTAICRHDHSGCIANGHDSIRIGPGKRSVDGEAIANHRSLIPPNQPFRGDGVLLDKSGEEIAYLPISPDVWFPNSDAHVCPPVSFGNYPPVSARRVSRIHVHLRNILLDVEVGHQILYVSGDRIGTRVGPFWKAGSLRGLARITICCDDNLAVNRFFPRRSNPASLIIREKVGLDTNVDMGAMASGNISEVTLEDMPIEDIGRERECKLMPSRTYQTNRMTCRVDSFRGCVNDIEILDFREKLLHLRFDRKIFATPDWCAENLLFLENIHLQAFL